MIKIMHKSYGERKFHLTSEVKNIVEREVQQVIISQIRLCSEKYQKLRFEQHIIAPATYVTRTWHDYDQTASTYQDYVTWEFQSSESALVQIELVEQLSCYRSTVAAVDHVLKRRICAGCIRSKNSRMDMEVRMSEHGITQLTRQTVIEVVGELQKYLEDKGGQRLWQRLFLFCLHGPSRYDVSDLELPQSCTLEVVIC